MTFNKDDPSTYDLLYEESKQTGKSLKQLCDEKGMKVRRLYDWKYEQNRRNVDLTVTKLVHNHTDKCESKENIDRSRAVFATIGSVELTIPYANTSELADIFGALKNV